MQREETFPCEKQMVSPSNALGAQNGDLAPFDRIAFISLTSRAPDRFEFVRSRRAAHSVPLIIY